MFTRVVELRCKSGKTNEVSNITSEKVLPILKKQPGFQDEIILVSNTDHNKLLAISFWSKREDAERYHRENFSRITEMIRPLCDADPMVATYDVHTSTVHHVSKDKAA